MEEQSATDCITGIYLITHIATGRPYVGLCGRIGGFKERWNDHRKVLRKNKYINKNPHFQNAWNKYGEEAFSFSVHTYIPQGDMSYEEFYSFLGQEEVRILRLFPEHLNGTTAGAYGMTHRPEVKKKIRNANLEKMKDPIYKARKIADINSPEGIENRILSNKSERIRKMRSVQVSGQMKNNPELKARCLSGMHSKESQEKATLGKRKKWSDPIWSAKMKKLIKESTNTPEVRKKQSEATKKLWLDPQTRAERLEINKRGGATRHKKALEKRALRNANMSEANKKKQHAMLERLKDPLERQRRKEINQRATKTRMANRLKREPN